jgi:hypothetical protein
MSLWLPKTGSEILNRKCHFVDVIVTGNEESQANVSLVAREVTAADLTETPTSKDRQSVADKLQQRRGC